MKHFFWLAVVLLWSLVPACKPASDQLTRHEQLEKQIERVSEARKRYLRELPGPVYESLHRQLAASHSIAKEFNRSFPQALQRSGRMERVGPPPPVSPSGIIQDQLVFSADLYGRYRLRCVIPFTLREDFRTVEKWEEPYFSIQHIYDIVMREDGSVTTRSRWVELPDGSFRFGLADWQRLRASDFDWAVIGVELIKEAPVDGFESLDKRSI